MVSEWKFAMMGWRSPVSVGSPNQVVILSAAKNLESSTPAGRICCVRGPDLSGNLVSAFLGTPGTPPLDHLLGREIPRYARNDGTWGRIGSRCSLE
jgi:hypothetical protein